MTRLDLDNDRLPLVIVSMLSPLYADIYRAIAEHLAKRLDFPVVYRDDVEWRDRQRLLLAGEAQVGFLCGLPYAREAIRPEPRLSLLAAPVMRAERYRDRPIYFSDVVVRRDSPFERFKDLAGSSFAYNEPDSQSGHNIVKYQLAQMGQTEALFGSVVESGAHAESLAMILRGEVDASAIDSTVLEMELRAHPGLSRQIRIVAVLGPSPIQPIVASRHLDKAMCERLRKILTTMHLDPRGGRTLETGPIRRLDPVADADYDEIRLMERRSAHIQL